MKIIHIHRYLSGEATPEEKEVLESWLERTEENRDLFESYRKIYDVEIRYKYKYNTEEALSRFRQIMRENVKGDTPLVDVLNQLKLHFNETITINDSSTLEDPVTSGYRNESLDEILEYTSLTHCVCFKIEQP